MATFVQYGSSKPDPPPINNATRSSYSIIRQSKMAQYSTKYGQPSPPHPSRFSFVEVESLRFQSFQPKQRID